MLITFSCPECKAELEVAATAGGSLVPCPQCNKTLTVPKKGPGPGVTIGQFQIQKLLGKGGMGEVYLARQLSLGRDVALKILPARLRDQKARVQRFFKEVQLLARLDHPNIVMAHEAGEDDDILYLAMSYVPGDSLEKCLQRDGPMRELDALKMIDKLAGALDYAWREHHLLHRDIKPANILLTSGGEAKLTDFGLAKCLDDATELTMSGDIIGSPNYMSPEQINNCMDLDCRSDMYSLGTTLYHLLTGKLPFAGSSLMETLKKQINESLPDPRIDHPGISEACIVLLEIMLAKKRNDRHADYQALRADIARVMAREQPTKGALQPGESVLLRLHDERTQQRSKSPPAGSNPPVKKTRGRGVKWVFVVMLALVAALALAVVTARISRRAHKPATPTGMVPGEAMAPTIIPITSAPVEPKALASTPAVDAEQTKLNEVFLDALKYAREHPHDFTGARNLLTSLEKDSKGTAWDGKIADELRRVERARKLAVYNAVTALKADVQAQVSVSNFEGALKRIELDPGLVTEETTAARAELAQEVKARKQASEEALVRQKAETEQARQSALAREKLAILAQGLAGDLLKGDTTALTQRLKEAQTDTDLSIVTNEVSEIDSLARQAAGWPERVARSFEENRDKSVAVEFKGNRTETLLVKGIAGETINCQRKVSAGYVGRDFSINDLSAGEKLKRLGDDSQPAVKLMRGLVSVRCANDWTAARKEFASGGALGEALIRQAPPPAIPAIAVAVKPADTGSAVMAPVELKKPTSTNTTAQNPVEPKERHARQALLKLLKLADVDDDLSDVQALADTIRRKEFSSNTASKIIEGLIDFNKNYAQTETAQENARILNALRSVGRFLPPDQRPFKQKWRHDFRPMF
ncbi:MAG: protein kinase [Kiritimatiellae bacterium]|nr:protein kinase [Kiritimatiellia bacterium]